MLSKSKKVTRYYESGLILNIIIIFTLVLCLSNWINVKAMGNVLTTTSNSSYRGAILPYIELEAENGKTDGSILGPSTALYDKATEASGRKAVMLYKKTQYVEWVAPSAANSIVIRYCIPDSANGTGTASKLILSINSKNKQTIAITSKYAWEYGDFPWSKNPSFGKAHKFYDEVHTFTDKIKKGDKIKLVCASANTKNYCIIDLIDLENVASPKAKPSNYLSISEFGAIPNDGKDDTSAFNSCLMEAKQKGKGVWIPKGSFNIDAIDVEGVTIRGAGMWYSSLTGPYVRFNCIGDDCKFYDFAILGDTNFRDDNSATDNAFCGWPGKNSVVDSIWVEHKKCGFWVGDSAQTTPVENLKITNCRFRNLMADGINFCNGTSNSLVENCSFRYTGDDAIATWSVNTNVACNNNTLRHNTIQIPWLASGISIYGGSNHTIEYNLVSDTITGGSGIYISSNFDPVPLSGTITARNNTLIRCGSNECYTGFAPGAIRLLAFSSDIDKAKIVVSDNDIIDAVQSGISIQGPKKMDNVIIKNISINGCKAYGIHVDNNVTGTASFEAVSVKDALLGGLNNEAGAGFVVKKVDVNTGW